MKIISELEGSKDYSPLFNKIIARLDMIDYNNTEAIEKFKDETNLNLDYIASSITGEDPSSVSSDQSRGYYTDPAPKKDIKETVDVYDFLNQSREQIMLNFGPRTFRNLQTQLTMGDEAPVRDWLIKNGYMDEDKLPFEEIETPGEKNAREVATKAKQIVKKTGIELGNLAKDVYDTPTIKRLRAYINNELEKLIDKHGVDYPGKQIKIPFDKKS